MAKQELTHKNSFGLLRLILAICVINHHAFYQKDGHNTHELLTLLFGSISIGNFAVDGFFMISGYLITKSFIYSNNIYSYIIKRVGRIYPGFIVAFLITMLGFGYVGGVHYPELFYKTLGEWSRILLLKKPILERAFPGVPFPGTMNMSMWTLKFEFRCYLLLPLLGLLGFLKKYRLAAVSIFSIILVIIYPHSRFFRLFAMFLSGSVMFIYKEHIPLTWKGLLISFAGVILSLNCGKYAGAGVAIFGSYMFISFALLNSKGIMTVINNKNDFSYGIYIYAWPIERTLIYYFPHMGYWEIFVINIILVFPCAMLSWFLIEKPCMRYAHKLASKFQSRGKGNLNISVI